MRKIIVISAVVMLAVAIPAYASGHVWSEVEDNAAYVHHDDAYFNCCPSIQFEYFYWEYSIDIYERDYGFEPCFCMCYFDFEHKFEGLEPGTYTVQVWEESPGEGPSLAGTTQFRITAQVGTISETVWMSECHDGVEESPENRIEIEVSSSAPVVQSAEIGYSIPVSSPVSIHIYDVTGTRVREIELGNQDAGAHTFIWDTCDDFGQSVPRGSYFVRLNAADLVADLQLIVLR